jgi:hypothetical protein
MQYGEASDHLCGKSLEVMLPTLAPALERHGHLEIEPALRQKLLQVSPATIDRMLAPARAALGGQHRRRRARVVTGVRRRTAVHTFNGWKGVEPGWFEMDGSFGPLRWAHGGPVPVDARAHRCGQRLE